MNSPIPSSRPEVCRGGFTLIELLVVVAILGILILLAFPTIQNARNNSYTAPCMNNQRQIVAAMLAYAADNDGRLPDVSKENGGGSETERWNFKIAEYLNIPFSKFFGPNAKALRCPAAKKGNSFSYGLNYSTGDKRIFSKIGTNPPPSGSSNPNHKGSERLVNLFPSMVLIADAHDPNNPESDLFYSPNSPNYLLTDDRDGDGVKDSSGNLALPRKFNCIDPRHASGKAFVCVTADGAAKLMTIREWAENPKYWGPK